MRHWLYFGMACAVALRKYCWTFASASMQHRYSLRAAAVVVAGGAVVRPSPPVQSAPPVSAPPPPPTQKTDSCSGRRHLWTVWLHLLHSLASAMGDSTWCGLVPAGGSAVTHGMRRVHYHTCRQMHLPYVIWQIVLGPVASVGQSVPRLGLPLHRKSPRLGAFCVSRTTAMLSHVQATFAGASTRARASCSAQLEVHSRTAQC
jgi:hypothetical protein